MERISELRENLAQVKQKIALACSKSARDPSEITLIAVTKTFPAADVELLAEIGVCDVGENKDQEAKLKSEQVNSQVDWHFIGQLQTNKVKSVIRYASFIHSVDRINLAVEISKQCEASDKDIKVLIQVELAADDQTRGGVAPAELFELAQRIQGLPKLQLVGLMAVAPLKQSAVDAFQRLIEIRTGFLADFPAARLLSIGMSDDFETAIQFGATHLRIGSLLLGGRPNLG